jgi:deoxyribodipyrimidine photolyase-related protein
VTKLLLLSGNHLFDARWLPPPADTHILMVEDPELCRRLPFHQQKLAFLLAGMRDHRDALLAAGYHVHYFALQHTPSMSAAAEQVLDALRTENREAELLSFAHEDRHISTRITRIARQNRVPLTWLKSPMFLSDEQIVEQHIAHSRHPRMEQFYRAQRKQLGVLMEDGEPKGGRWNFDKENRRAYPANHGFPNLDQVDHSANASEVMELVAAQFPDHPGDARALWLPTRRNGALTWLHQFIDERLVGFGTWEDAMSSRTRVGNHSVLSPFLNCGLITPDEAVSTAICHAQTHDVPLNDLEGFIRQVIGWREFVRGVNKYHNSALRTGNAWNAQRRMKSSWYTARTGITPLDEALQRANDWGWNHHIERLIVLANFMNLAEIAPRDVYRYFMTHHIDAYDWVMAPNVYGMGLTSDGGVFATKPYVCSSNYQAPERLQPLYNAAENFLDMHTELPQPRGQRSA